MHILRLARIALDLFSQTPHMNIYRTHISRLFVSPHKIQKILPAVDFVRVVDKKL